MTRAVLRGSATAQGRQAGGPVGTAAGGSADRWASRPASGRIGRHRGQWVAGPVGTAVGE
ncbi:hypothetical protein [Nesterenkonia sphaerica]|uniref:Uncharacterized protein n=1 Tax=Nesterenkonia sphaerica TaxID=1804988 RepID=A0A5R9AMZ4_9MICC|nr:hypothetical protein [Nesterenkonia sphaerica]TLP79375.1 hypothetical protein FEF27_01885 [Nesterenkonia sphaerica]